MQTMTKLKLLTGALLLVAGQVAQAAPIFTPNSQPTGWVSTPVVTFFDVSSGTESFFHVDFRKSTWAGNIIAKDINSTARVQSTGPWDEVDPTLATAGSLLDAVNFNTGRKIATKGRAFRWGSLTEGQKDDLGSEKLLNFIRGDRANEEPNGESYYQRASVLGDILHSNIYFWDYGNSQSLYVGANDGMLHSFDAKTGAENFAYIPSMLIPNLSKLAEKTYVHTYFVDGPITIANVEVSGSVKTILVGALGAGGKGIYALDVTSPAAADEAAVAAKALWEIDATGSFANLGYTYGTPVFARLNSGTAAVIFGNGYVNGGNGRAYLYVVNANTGALISAIDTGSGSQASPNGLSSPTLYDVEGDGKPEFAYAGDIDGNMWKFDLKLNTVSKLFTTSPVQAITTAPVVHAQPLGGQMVAFVTGRVLTTGDKLDDSVHYAYGIWDGAPVNNNALLTQTLASSTFTHDGEVMNVRSVSNNVPKWNSGSGNHKGWKVALSAGERAVGEKPFYNAGRLYFLATNPTVGTGENWLVELVHLTGGSPPGPIFDLNEDGAFTSADLAANGKVPVAKFLGSGVFSQPRLVDGDNLTTTLYAFHPDLPISQGVPIDPDDPGVSGGHFDFDIYYYDYDDADSKTITTPNYDDFEIINNVVCEKSKDVDKHLDEDYDGCEDNASDGYTFLSEYSPGAICKDDKKANKIKYWQTLTCNTSTTETFVSAPYQKYKHEHEYDDKYDVTGVNMLNASLTDFNLINALPDATTEFKILVMNQYLNPAAKLSVGGAEYVGVKSYEGLASNTNATSLLSGLPTYSRATVSTLIFNLPLDAFKSKDWWGNGSQLRAGLIPTQTGCVNGVEDDGESKTPGPNGERFNGALTIQLIKPDTPPGQIELNGPNVSYGWRVKEAQFIKYVLAEYTAFWHHPNKHCYDDSDWVPDPPEDFDSDDKTKEPAPGSADPKDGIFGFAIVQSSTTTSVDGLVTTTVATYSDGTTWTKVVTVDDEGNIVSIYQIFRDGTEDTYIPGEEGDGGEAGFVDPNTGSPIELKAVENEGRQTWRETYE